MPDPLSRRQAITYGVGAAAAGALAGPRLGTSRSTHTPKIWIPGDAPRFPQPRVQSSRDGELSVVMTGRRANVDMNAPKLVNTYTLNGVVPGYTWELRPGDTLKVHLRNRLPELPPMPMHMDRPHQWTNMNLHTHGLHVSPTGDEDNVFIDIPRARITSTRSMCPPIIPLAASGTTPTGTAGSPSNCGPGWPGS